MWSENNILGDGRKFWKETEENRNRKIGVNNEAGVENELIGVNAKFDYLEKQMIKAMINQMS